MQRRLIIEQFDPEKPKPGGIDTCIRGLVKYCPPEIELRLVGVDAIGNKKIGVWEDYIIGGRKVGFMPVARLDHANLRRSVPHSALVARGLLKYRPAYGEIDVVQTHRINTGAVADRLYRKAAHVQFIHTEGDLQSAGSQSFFRHSVRAYRYLERVVIPSAVDTVVFSKSGAARLQTLSPQVRFSPTWYDPSEFFPAVEESASKSRLIWACRIEPGKNPDLAVDIMSTLPEQYTLTVAGAGTLESAMRDRATKSAASDRIRFAGAIPKSDIGAVMREHDLMLMTSSFEGYSRAIVEGLASGLPVITTPGGEPNGLVQTGVNGAHVEGYIADLFRPAVEIASKLSASAARASVDGLSAELVVPDVLSIPERP